MQIFNLRYKISQKKLNFTSKSLDLIDSLEWRNKSEPTVAIR